MFSDVVTVTSRGQQYHQQAKVVCLCAVVRTCSLHSLPPTRGEVKPIAAPDLLLVAYCCVCSATKNGKTQGEVSVHSVRPVLLGRQSIISRQTEKVSALKDRYPRNISYIQASGRWRHPAAGTYVLLTLCPTPTRTSDRSDLQCP